MLPSHVCRRRRRLPRHTASPLSSKQPMVEVVAAWGWSENMRWALVWCQRKPFKPSLDWPTSWHIFVFVFINSVCFESSWNCLQISNWAFSSLGTNHSGCIGICAPKVARSLSEGVWVICVWLRLSLFFQVSIIGGCPAGTVKVLSHCLKWKMDS